MRGHVTRKKWRDKDGNEKLSRTWYVVVDVRDESGKRHRKWFSGYRTKKAAETALAEKLHEIDTGAHIPVKQQTVAEYFTRWLADRKPELSYHTHRKYGWLINHHIIPGLGKHDLTKLRPSHLQSFYAKLREGDKALSSRSVLHIHRVMHTALDRAVKWGVVNRNVADAVDTPRAGRYHGSIWTLEETSRFLTATKQTEPRTWAVFVVAVTTGMRQSEIMGLKWSDIDMEARTISIQRSMNYIGGKPVYKDVKRARSRRSIEISETTIEALRYQHGMQAEDRMLFRKSYPDTDCVYTTPEGAPLSQNSVNTAWHRALSEVDVPRIRFHDLRHSHASHLLQQGVHAKIVSERLGHASIGITLDTYSHLIPGMQKNAVDILDSALRAVKK